MASFNSLYIICRLFESLIYQFLYTNIVKTQVFCSRLLFTSYKLFGKNNTGMFSVAVACIEKLQIFFIITQALSKLSTNCKRFCLQCFIFGLRNHFYGLTDYRNNHLSSSFICCRFMCQKQSHGQGISDQRDNFFFRDQKFQAQCIRLIVQDLCKELLHVHRHTATTNRLPVSSDCDCLS